jgi:hypothetical protein
MLEYETATPECLVIRVGDNDSDLEWLLSDVPNSLPHEQSNVAAL